MECNTGSLVTNPTGYNDDDDDDDDDDGDDDDDAINILPINTQLSLNAIHLSSI
jgi:hypothetical protein